MIKARRVADGASHSTHSASGRRIVHEGAENNLFRTNHQPACSPSPGADPSAKAHVRQKADLNTNAVQAQG